MSKMSPEIAAATVEPLTNPVRPPYVYVIYIRTTAEKLWEALTSSDFTRRYWCEVTHDTTWKPGSSWALKTPDGRLADVGEVIEFDPPRRLVVSWAHTLKPEFKTKGHSRCTFELEPAADSIKLTITHALGTMDPTEANTTKFFEGISGGWPAILSSLKSLLETGEALEATKHWPKDM
jgi:uncharacterized protein YndB with AHSA1/START domain